MQRVRESVLSAYQKVMENKELLYLRSHPWKERIKVNPWRTIWYALSDRFWYVIVGITGNPLLTMRTFWGDKMLMSFPDYRCVLHNGLIDSRELPVEDFVLKNLKEGDVFMDIGANVGFYTLLAHALGARVYAFDPSPNTFEILRKNAPGDAVLVNKALMDKKGTIQFTDKEIASGTNTAVVMGTEDNLIEVEADTLDAYCQEHAIRPVIIKIDVEGAEYDTIRGGIQTIATYKPILIVETGNVELVHYICSMGYAAFKFGTEGEIIPYAESAVYSPNLLFRPI